jgi:hypothetical protein
MPGRHRPHVPPFFYESDGGHAAEVNDFSDVRVMAAMLPRPVASFLLRIYLLQVMLIWGILDRVRVSGILHVSELQCSPLSKCFFNLRWM